MDKNASGIPVEQAAKELGVPADALRLYLAAHKPSGSAASNIPEAQVGELKDELRSRAQALRLDDLAKTALTIEWLAEAAVVAAKSSESLGSTLSTLEKRVGEAKGNETDSKLEPINARLKAVEGLASDGSAKAVQLVGSVQGMVESQGRDLDALRADVGNLRSDVATLRSDIAALRVGVHDVEAKQDGLLNALRTALQIEGVAASGKAKAGAQVSHTTSAAETKSGAPETKPSGPKTDPPVASAGDEAIGKVENVPVTTPAKFRVKREIEYNFLLERMGYRRLDSYGTNERVDDKFPVDGEIALFLATFELGCDPDEVEMVSVQRGEFHMVQYQRIEKAAGIRSWMSRGRS